MVSNDMGSESKFELILYYELSNTPELANIDFFVKFQDKTYKGSACTVENIIYCMNRSLLGEDCYSRAKADYFIQTDMVVLREMTVECLKATIEDIIDDPSLSLDIFFSEQLYD